MLSARIAAVVATLLLLIFGAQAALAQTPAPPVLIPTADSVAANPVFTWEPADRATKYRIELSTSPSFTSVTWTDDVFGTTATPAAELPVGTLYWRVATFSGAIQGAFSDPLSFNRQQPAAPTLLTPNDAATLAFPSEAPVMSWSAVPGVKNYRVQVDDVNTFSSPASNGSHVSLLVSGSVTMIATRSLGVVTWEKSTVRSSSESWAAAKGYCRTT